MDPESELEDTHHVLEEGGVVYNAVLGLVDVVRGTNSYYKLQLLQGDKGSGYCIFRSWGRVGTTIGGTKLQVWSFCCQVGRLCALLGGGGGGGGGGGLEKLTACCLVPLG